MPVHPPPDAVEAKPPASSAFVPSRSCRCLSRRSEVGPLLTPTREAGTPHPACSFKKREFGVRPGRSARLIRRFSIFVEIWKRIGYPAGVSVLPAVRGEATDMARKPSKNLTERELEIMQVLWSLREARLGEIQEAL